MSGGDALRKTNLLSDAQPQSSANGDEKGKEAMANEENRPLTTVAFKSFEGKYATAQEGNASYQRKSLRFSVLTFCAVSAYTAVTFFVLVFSGLAWKTEKDNLYYSQRATVVLNDLEPLAVALNGTLVGYVVIPEWTNVGNTYASEMNYHDEFQFSHEDLPGGFSAFTGPTKVEGPASLGPKQTLTAGAFRTAEGIPMYFPEPCFLDAVQGKYKFIHIWGWTTYADVLRPENKRVTRFCWSVFGTLNVNGKLEFNHYLCDEGNCQDDACTTVYSRITPPKMPQPELCQPLAIPSAAALAPTAAPISPAQPPQTPPEAPAPAK
jgi:hypothetical protein